MAQQRGEATTGRASESERRTLFCVGDLTLYDRSRLRAELAVRDELVTDHELVLLAYQRWNEHCFARLNGDFALAVWDGHRGQLVLARDIAGLRPLHFRRQGQAVDFASMAGPLAQLDGSIAAPDYERWLRYSAMLPHTGSASFFSGVERIEPGEAIVFAEFGIRRVMAWVPPVENADIGFDEAVRAMRAALDAAVADRASSCSGPISLQLSAGMDSSAVLASTARQFGDTVYAFTGAPVPGSAGPLEPGYFADESEIAARTSALYSQVVHERVQSSLEPTLAFADRWHGLIEHPLRNYDNLGWMEATFTGAARRGSAQILTGLFGNISFSYNGSAAIPEALLNGDWARWARLTAAARRQPKARWRGALARSLPAFASPERRQTLLTLLGKDRAYVGFADTNLNLKHPMIADLRNRTRNNEALMTGRTRSGRSERLAQIRLTDQGCFTYGARERWGIEQRDPTADRRVIDLAMQLPTEIFIHQGRQRSLAIEVLRGTVDDAVLAPHKGLQGEDWHLSFAKSVAEMRQEVRRLRDHRNLTAMIKLDDLEAGLDSWERDPLAGRADAQRFESITRTLCAGRWARRIIDGETGS